MPRWILLEHVNAPDDPAGRHYDLLVEEGEACRTWRLAAIPRVGGPAVPAEAIAPHRLAWLDHEAGEVSGGRGFARRVDGGNAAECPADPVGTVPPEAAPDLRPRHLDLHGALLDGTLVIAPDSGAGEAVHSVRLVGRS